MNLKDILVHVDTSPGCSSRIEAAITLAQEHKAHLTGLYIESAIVLPTVLDAPIPPNLIDELHDQANSMRERATRTFDKAIAGHKGSTEWRVTKGETLYELELHGSYADLLVVGQSYEEDIYTAVTDLPDAAVIGVGRPVMVIPSKGPRSTLGKRIVVAWNASRESVRALNDALPLLQRAELVEVVFVNPPKHRAIINPVASADISVHLARHGVKAVTKQIHDSHTDTGDELLSRATEFEADLMVMGAYGHSRVRELVFGGVTRHVLQNMTLPVLMSH